MLKVNNSFLIVNFEHVITDWANYLKLKKLHYKNFW